MKKFLCMLFFCMSAILSGCSSNTNKADCFNCYTREDFEFKSWTSNPDFIFVYPVDSEKVCIYEYSHYINNGNVYFTDEMTYNYMLSSGEKTELFMPVRNPQNTIRAMKDGRWITWEELQMNVLSADGTLLGSADFTTITFENEKAAAMVMPISDYYDGSNWYIIGIDSNGASSLYILDKELNGKLSVPAKNIWKSVQIQGEYYFFESGSEKLKKYDSNKNKMVEAGKAFPGSEEEYNFVVLVNGDASYDYYYYYVNLPVDSKFENCLYAVKDGKKIALFNMKDMGLDNFTTQLFVSDEAGGFWCFGSYNFASKEMVLYHYIASDIVMNYSADNDKEKVIIATIGESMSITHTVNMYNHVSDRYCIELVDYGKQYGDYDNATTHLYMDCMNGKVDGILLDNIDEDIFVRAGALEDLSGYLDNSEIICREDFIPNYMSAVMDQDNHVYALYATYSVKGYAYKEAIDFSNISQYDEFVTSGTYFFSCLNPHLGFCRLMNISGNRYIDEKNKKVCVNDSSFQTLLQHWKKMQLTHANEFVPVRQYAYGEAYCLEVEFKAPFDYWFTMLLFNKDCVISNPVCDTFLMGEKLDQIAVCANSQHKAAIYELYDYMFSPVYYHQNYFFSHLPVLSSEWEMWERYLMATESYMDEFGLENPVQNVIYNYDDIEEIMEPGTLTKNEIQSILKNLKNAKYIKPMKTAYLDIILEEADAYFADTISLDQATENMEKRLNLAIEENN